MDILGIACYYHDASSALVRDGKVLAAAQEERFTRIKHDNNFPRRSIDSCLRIANSSPSKLGAVVFYEKPVDHFYRLLETNVEGFPYSFSFFIDGMREWFSRKFFLPHAIRQNLPGFDGPIYFVPHHVSHAASAFYCSPFQSAAILTADGVGEWTTTSWGIGDRNKVELKQELRYPHSLGLLYSIVTQYLGFKPNSAEYKIMGLAAYGKPRFADKFRQHIIDIKDDGSFSLNKDYFPCLLGRAQETSLAFQELFGEPPHQGEDNLTQFHKDMAASIQAVTEDVMLRLAKSLYKRSGLDFLCMAGGVALNSVANGIILKQSGFKDVFFQPASNDAGGAIGCALYAAHHILNNPRTPGSAVKDDYLGPGYSDDQVKSVLDSLNVRYQYLDREAINRYTAQCIADGRIVGWYQGRLEHGQRALGNRSILADPRDPKMKDILNARIKFREPFRPFAPSVLEERSSEFFDIACPAPYMMLTVPVRKDKHSVIPAVTHEDGSSRLQSVSSSQNPRYHALIKEFERITGVPMVINTSFNRRGEPIVESPEDALRCFAGTGMDVLILHNFVVTKSDLPESFQKSVVASTD